MIILQANSIDQIWLAGNVPGANTAAFVSGIYKSSNRVTPYLNSATPPASLTTTSEEDSTVSETGVSSSLTQDTLIFTSMYYPDSNAMID